jgi:hypothetical protein
MAGNKAVNFLVNFLAPGTALAWRCRSGLWSSFHASPSQARRESSPNGSQDRTGASPRARGAP